MTQLLDIKAFLVTARTRSFSAAAREVGVAPSVITKRVSRLEHTIGSKLFVRSTRQLTLTAEGERLRPRLQLLVGELADTLADTLNGAQRAERGVTGQLRIKAPTTVGALHVGPSIAAFRARNPNVTIELLLIDRSVNPLEEGFDVAIGALPASYANVLDIPLCAYERVLVASPAYLARNRAPKDPTELVEHDCLTFLPIGHTWSFDSPKGAITVEVRSSFSVNDSRVLLAAALEGAGIAVIPGFLAREALADGRLEALLPRHPLTPLWLKALVPRSKVKKPEIAAVLEHLRADFEPVPPWER